MKLVNFKKNNVNAVFNPAKNKKLRKWLSHIKEFSLKKKLLIFLPCLALIICGIGWFFGLGNALFGPNDFSSVYGKVVLHNYDLEITSAEWWVPNSAESSKTRPADSEFNKTKPLYLLMHGYSGEETAWPDLLRNITQEDTSQYVSLRAPIPLEKNYFSEGGYAWFEPAVPDEGEVLGVGSYAGELESRKAVVKWIEQNIPEDQPIIAMGFSQGAVMAGVLADSGIQQIKGAVMLSGWVSDRLEFYDQSSLGQDIIPFSDDDHPVSLYRGMPIFFGYGDKDQIIPIERLEESLKRLEERLLKFNITSKVYPGIDHSIPEEEIADVREFLKKTLAEYKGANSNCKAFKCMSVTVNGDILMHPALWNNFKTADGFNYEPLLAGLKPYLAESDVSICDFETPIAPLGGPYLGYPVFNIPPQIVPALKKVGYTACTTATNHTFDQGTAGIGRLIDELDKNKIAHTGSYKTQEESAESLVIPSTQGKVGLLAATVSLNGQTANFDWQVDRLREADEAAGDISKILKKADSARQYGADIVTIALHSVQEYIDYADNWQINAAHELADTGKFDFIYSHGSHSVEPVELYNGVWIIYGVGNTITSTAGGERIVNDQGATFRVTFSMPISGLESKPTVESIDWVGSSNEQNGKYAWCSLGEDHPQGSCKGEASDAAINSRLNKVIHSMGVAENSKILQPWILNK